ncbi:MAG TPA: hypothetical protein VHO06_12785 [Polyangia bacterium]|nr:hypothetical protein [Polyangia bacterium]
MKSFIRATKLTFVAAAIALFSFASTAHAGSYTDVVGNLQTVQGSNGTIYTIFQAGGFAWGIPATDPGFNAYTTMLAAAWQKGHHISVGCTSCSATSLTAPALTGTWQIWYPQWIGVLAN